MSKMKQTFYVIVMLWMAVLTTSCVTVKEPDAFERNKDLEKSLKTYVTLGIRYLQQGDMENASRTLNKAYEINSDDPQVNNALALFYTVEDEPAQVVQHYEAALKEDPNFSTARNNYAAFLFEQGDYSKALEQLKVVTKDYRYPRRFQSFENMGLCYIKLEDIPLAEKAFKRALQLNPRQPKSLIEMAEISFNKQEYRATTFYMSQLDKLKVGPSPRKLWLEIQLSRVLGNKNKLASLELALKNLFPDSAEYKAFLASQEQWL